MSATATSPTGGPSTRDRFRGCLLGLAAGDALGTTLEFRPPGSFEPIDDMVGGGPFRLRPGQWTDDTSMALCLAESLLECGGFDAADQMRRYVRWWREGYLSSTGRCFDIGNTVRAALSRFVGDGDPYAGSTDPRSAGNGSLMRLAPVPMTFTRSWSLRVRHALTAVRDRSSATASSRFAMESPTLLKISSNSSNGAVAVDAAEATHPELPDLTIQSGGITAPCTASARSCVVRNASSCS